MAKLFVGVDLEEGYGGPVEWAQRLAEWTGFELELVHVVERVPAEAGVQALRSRRPEALQRILDEAEQEVRQRLVEWGIEGAADLPVTVRIGRPARELTARAAESEEGVLVLGPGRRRWMDTLLGTTTDRALRKAKVPVVVARGILGARPDRVLASVDLSEGSDLVLREARRWASSLDASAVAYHVPQPRWTNAFLEGRREHVYDEMFESPEEMEERASSELTELLSSVGQGDGRFEAELGESRADPAEALERRLSKGDVGLMVMGTHGVGGVDRMILGSVAETLARRSPVPVVVVPGP